MLAAWRPPSQIIPELPIIRTRREGEQRATFFELFFDLVYVFAVTQLSHHLLKDLSWSGAAERRSCSSRCTGPGITRRG